MDMAEPKRFTPPGLRGELRMKEPMSRHVSWRAGGCAERMYVPADLADLATYLKGLPGDEPLWMVGLGSNLLVRDGGLRGTVVLLHGALRKLRLEQRDAGGALLYAEAGVASPKVARFAAVHDLWGAEFLAGIPGTVGGALAMNAGCYGRETWESVEKVLSIDRAGTLRKRPPSDYEVRYRHVALRAASVESRESDDTPREEWFAAAWLRLPAGDGHVARERIRDLLGRRIASQPLGQPNAGSVFRNPPGTFAARLIEDCGLKGFRLGGAMVSPKHANFIVNAGGASAADIEAVIERCRRSVLERSGIALEPEVRIIGEALSSEG
ncbi:MAG TPA: UDP-N-acetylmuramate dehydrogenase [Burkholderiales bacterium]